MLKIMRRGAIENPWFYRIIMGGLAVAFMISMGWWGFSGSGESNAVAQVDQAPISLDEYHRAYQNLSNVYREIFQDKYDDKLVRKQAIDQLVERKLWLKEAQRMNLTVSDAELRDSIVKLPGFQRDGKFDPEIYRRVLAFEHFTPEAFERQQREQLLIVKANALVKDAVALTPMEAEEAKKSNPNNPDPDRAVADLLFQKKEKAVRAYALGLKNEASIHIKDEML